MHAHIRPKSSKVWHLSLGGAEHLQLGPAQPSHAPLVVCAKPSYAPEPAKMSEAWDSGVHRAFSKAPSIDLLTTFAS